MPQDPILRSFDLLARRNPLAPLILSTEHRSTIGDVDALARAAAACLAALPSLVRGVLVGLVAANGPGFLASFLALRRAGCAALLLDGQTPAAEATRIARALGAAALFSCRTGWPQGPDDWSLAGLETVETGSQDLASMGQDLASMGSIGDIAVVKLTSGSTGAPRGIATPAAALLADDAALTATMGIRADDRLLTTIPMAHSYGLSSLVMPALLRGTPLILPAAGSLFDPFLAAARLEATVFPTVPAYLDALLRTSEAHVRPPALRLVITAGAPLSPAIAHRFRDTFGLAAHVFYGASECGGICYDRTGDAGERGTLGTPVDGVQVTLEGEAGLVAVRSAAVAAGYLPALPALPAPDPRLGEGRYLAGDLGAWQNGELVLRGRLDGLVNIKGKKINPREVEEVLGRLAGVDEVVVLGVPVPGRPEERLRAVIACPPGRITVEDVLAWCRGHLAPHKVPRSVILVPAMPRTARGKLDRAALLALGTGYGASAGHA
jgi:acyl-CoA synthetase (AMP-forming)/AMP-acid ligase II